ncbi:hypothetical protein B0H19DRAFT_196314 [Mycena capillaripes]|nr:hypothetical protein B0H19DRAFT_196314 [Mycena capillaripes]
MCLAHCARFASLSTATRPSSRRTSFLAFWISSLDSQLQSMYATPSPNGPGRVRTDHMPCVSYDVWYIPDACAAIRLRPRAHSSTIFVLLRENQVGPCMPTAPSPTSYTDFRATTCGPSLAPRTGAECATAVVVDIIFSARPQISLRVVRRVEDRLLCCVHPPTSKSSTTPPRPYLSGCDRPLLRLAVGLASLRSLKSSDRHRQRYARCANGEGLVAPNEVEVERRGVPPSRSSQKSRRSPLRSRHRHLVLRPPSSAHCAGVLPVLSILIPIPPALPLRLRALRVCSMPMRMSASHSAPTPRRSDLGVRPVLRLRLQRRNANQL